MHRFGILHPGAMGTAVAAAAKNSGCEVYWVSEGRSPNTRRRAADLGLLDAGSLAVLCSRCTVIASVCPPEFAENIAGEIVQAGFRGIYLDANAISPQRKKLMAQALEQRWVRFVDGGIIGFPSTRRGETWLCLSGPCAADVAALFSAGPMETDLVGAEVGQASALKMCFAAWTKGSTALLCALMGAAEHYGVLDDLKRQWERRGPSLADVEREVVRAAPKAWRFVAEMHEIAATLEAAGMPPGFHQGAAQIYERLRAFKDAESPSVRQVLDTLNTSSGDTIS
jgi:3-hydroxyisobutyrate dehydrogenase-like beta-hydroxyacid dehydrogenase